MNKNANMSMGGTQLELIHTHEGFTTLLMLQKRFSSAGQARSHPDDAALSFFLFIHTRWQCYSK
jgi:hypothetical protein